MPLLETLSRYPSCRDLFDGHNDTKFLLFQGVNSALTTFFFGKRLDEKLTIEKFLEFQQQLQREILSLEFKRKLPGDDGKITESDFAELLLAYAGYSDKKKAKKVKRVKRCFRDHGTGISLKDYLDFFHFLNNINDVDTALTFYHIAGASIDQATLKHVAKTVAHVELTDHVIDVVFTIFDENSKCLGNFPAISSEFSFQIFSRSGQPIEQSRIRGCHEKPLAARVGKAQGYRLCQVAQFDAEMCQRHKAGSPRHLSNIFFESSTFSPMRQFFSLVSSANAFLKSNLL